MTNEEKAREIADEYFWQDNAESYAPNAILEMAEWKDQQFKEYLEGRIAQDIKNQNDAFNKRAGEASFFYSARIQAYESIIDELFPESEQDNTDRKEQVATTGQVCSIDEIINELFKEDKK